MTVELTSPVLGQAVGTNYTGALEAWLLAEGYAKQAGYTGPGVSNTGATDVDPDDDPSVASNREVPYFPLTEDQDTTIANDAANLTDTSHPHARFDFDAAGTDAEAPVVFEVSPAEGPATGGTVVTISGDNLEGVTGVTFDAVAGTALDVTQAGEGLIKVTTPAGAAGPADVVVTDAAGSDTEVGAFTYTA
jgi:hypothetical protein